MVEEVEVVEVVEVVEEVMVEFVAELEGGRVRRRMKGTWRHWRESD